MPSKTTKIVKADQKLKKAISDYINNDQMRKIVDWIECDATIEGFHEQFGGWSNAKKLSILENSQFRVSPEKIEKYLNYVPEPDSE